MKENLSRLYEIFGINRRCIAHISDNVEFFYTKRIKPKKKFGKFQEGDKQTIRLRHLVPPVYALKEIQKRICSELQKRELPDCMYGSIEGSNNILNALQHINSNFFLTIDLKNFFTNITNNQVNKTLVSIGYSWDVARIITRLTTYEGSLPQGAPSSPVLANLAFANTALQLTEFVKKHGIIFTTFLDDLTFSSSKDFKQLVPGIIAIIKANKFYPHHKKIHYRKSNCEVTGLIVGNGKIKLVKEMQEESLINPRINGYARVVERYFNEHFEQLNH